MTPACKAALEAENERLRLAAEAYRDLCTCYRLGRQPSEALHKKLEDARAALGEP